MGSLGTALVPPGSVKSLPNCSTCKVIGLHCLKCSGCGLGEQTLSPKWNKLTFTWHPCAWHQGLLVGLVQRPFTASLEELCAWQSWGNKSPGQCKREISYHQPCAMHFPFSPCYAQSRPFDFRLGESEKRKDHMLNVACVKACFCQQRNTCSQGLPHLELFSP